MSCKNKKSNCVCEKVREIAAAQDEVANDHCCDISCEKSLRDLLSPAGNGNGNDTIPFMLLCGCDNALAGLLPYIGWGVRNVDTSCFGPIPSPFFRVKKFKDDDSCCAILELLYPSLCDETPDSLLDLIEFDGWFATGACLEVDLRNFTGITCFPPTTVMSPTTADLRAGVKAVKSLHEKA
ncbi:CotY/CotZ family spore coat protein [Halobacillus mangrovi]|uniref:CotY/CotZ family spore coat protein n=1 Tax=Halobacillus mangrovi TaxID=402384 RepID=UPI003D971AF9